MKEEIRAVKIFISVTDKEVEEIIIRDIKRLTISDSDSVLLSLTEDPLNADLILSNDLKLLKDKCSRDCQCVYLAGTIPGRITLPSMMFVISESDIDLLIVLIKRVWAQVNIEALAFLKNY